MSLQSVPLLSFDFFPSRPVQVEVSPSPLTSDAGLLPIRQFDGQIGLTEQFAAAIEDKRDVDIDDVTLAERFVAGDAVADDVVHRRAGRLAVAAIHERCGQRAAIEAERVDQPVDVFGRDAGLDLGAQHIETFGSEPPGLAHALESGRAVELDLSGFAQRRYGRVDVCHGVDIIVAVAVMAWRLWRWTLTESNEPTM